MKNIYLTLALLTLLCTTVWSQNVGVNTTGDAPDASAMLDVSSTDKGLLVPRVALTATNVADPVTAPAVSLLVYNTATAGTAPNNVSPGYYYWSGTTWIPFTVSGGAASSWMLNGNAGTTPASQFFGTTDDNQLVFRSNNVSHLELGSRTKLGLVQAYPDYDNGAERLTLLRSALQFEAAGASFYKPKLFTDANGNFRIKGSTAGNDIFEIGGTGASNAGGLEFITGDDGDEPIAFRSYNATSGVTSEAMRVQSGRVAIGATTFSAGSPEKLLVDAGNTTSYNLISARGSMDNDLQINVKNNSTGTNASSDIVAVADNGSTTTNFVGLGINGSGYTGPVMGGTNDAHLYNIGQNFLIGTGTASKALIFTTGGTSQATNERMRITGTGSVGIATTTPNANTKLDVAGSVKLGASGTVLKNVVTIEITTTGAPTVPAAVMTTVPISFTPGAYDLTLTVPTLSSARGTVRASFGSDLPAGVSVAWARVLSTTQVKVRLMNNSTTAQSLPAGTKIQLSIIEF